VPALFHAIPASKIKNIAVLKNAAEQVDAPGRRKIVLQINLIGSNVLIIRKPGVSNVRPINTRKNTVSYILSM
jgi:hypothetical protein